MALAYGIHAVLEALRAGQARVERICVERGLHSARLQEVIDLARQSRVPVSFEERSWLDRKSGGQRHQGIVCYIAEAPTFTVEDVLRLAASPGLLLVPDGIEDPHNLGAMLRSAEVAGADGVFIPLRRSAGISPAVVRASAGATAHLRIARSGNTAQLIDLLKKNGYWVVGLAAEGNLPLWQADFTVPTALILGGEETGLHRLVRERCDHLLSIPVRGRVSSYNVSVAAGIALYEVLRQRNTRAANP